MKNPEQSNNKFGQVLAALFAGAAVGALAGLLFAPEEGSKTRNKIAKKAKKIADDVQSTAHDVKVKVEQEANRWTHKADKFEDKAEERKHDMAQSVKQASEAMKN